MFKKNYWPACFWLVLLTILSVMPGVPMPKFNLFSMDKLGHAGAYAILTWLIFRGFQAAKGRKANWKEGIVIFCLSTGYGALMEFVQGTFFPYRFFELDDMLANGFGAFIVAIVIPRTKINNLWP